jgi:predicted ATPase
MRVALGARLSPWVTSYVSTADLYKLSHHGVLEHHSGAFFADHDRGRVGVAAGDLRHDRSVGNARRQNAKSWELRGAMSLARLRRRQGRPQEAVALLAPVLGWFTEGFDTADLKDAKALLDNLTEPAIAAEG